MLEKELKEFYDDCNHENHLLDNDTRIKRYLSFAGKFRELKTLKDNLNNNRTKLTDKIEEKVDELRKDIINLSKYFRVEFDTRSILEQNRIKSSDIDELMKNKGLTLQKTSNHQTTKKVYERYKTYKSIVSEHLEKGGELYDYTMKVSCGKGNAERLEKAIEALNEEGLGIIFESNDEAHRTFYSHEVVIVTNSLHANKIINKLYDLGASKNSIDIKTAFLLPNPSKILVAEEVEKYDISNFNPETLSKSVAFANNRNILAYRKENYINPSRQFGGITAKGLKFKVQGKVISENNAYIVKNPLTWVNADNPNKVNIKKFTI